MDPRKPKSCLNCALADLGEGFLSSEGTCANGVLIVGEAAGFHEAKAGLPFRPNAPAGGFLEDVLDLAKVSRQDFGLFNIVNCKPPGNELVGAVYEAEAIAHCRPNVDAAVERLQPRVLLALGNTALRALSGNPNYGITEVRGFVLDSVYGLPLISSYHPSFLIRGAEHLTGVLLHDIKRSLQIAKRGLPERITTNYVLAPSGLDVSNYLELLRGDNSLASAYDTETASILGEAEPDDWRRKRIIQIQFSSAVGQALVLEWPRHIEEAKAILSTPNPKWGWNDRLSDRLVLRGSGVVINGEQHDLMNAWAHLQPNFMSGKDEAHGDKGVPAKLMSLQSCLSFYYPEEGPYKGMVQRAIDAGADPWDTLRYYGAKDADYTFRLGVKLMGSLKRLGLW